MTRSKQNTFDELLIFVNLYQHAKNEAVSLICNGEIIDLKILKSDGLKAFWSISLEQDFSRMPDLGKSIANNINFDYRTNSVKNQWPNYFFKFKILNFWRYGWLNNPAMWLAENILADISGTKISQVWDLYRNTANNIYFQYRTNSAKIKDYIFQ